MKLNRIAAAACTFSATLMGAAQAQDGQPGDGPPRAGTKLDRVEVSARPSSDTDMRRRSQVAKQLYGREELDKFGDTNVADVLKRLPGITMAGSTPRMRGLGSGYTLILINGDPAPPGFDLGQLDPAQVERIEVTKGPSADQSAQAVAGAINIILKEAPKVTQRDLRLGLSHNAVRPGVSGSYTHGERQGGVSYSLPVSVFSWRGVNKFTAAREMPGTDGLPSQLTQAQEENYWGTGFNATPRLNWKISDEESLTMLGFVQQGHWHFNRQFDDSGRVGQPSQDDDSRNLGTWQLLRGNLQYQNQMNDTQRLELKAGVQEARGTFENETFSAFPRSSVGDNTDRNFTQAGKFAQLLGDYHSLSLGWDLEWRRREETRSVMVNGAPQLPGIDGLAFAASIGRQAVFAQDEWEISPQWSAYLGLRSERIETETTGDDGVKRRNLSSVTTPLLHLNYKLDPKGRDLIRSSLTRSYKAPNLNQILARPALNSQFPKPTDANTALTPDFIGNPDLKPELATGLDVAYEKYLSGGGMISVGGFYRRVNNVIRNVTGLVVSTSPDRADRYVTRPENFSSARSVGLELEIKGRAGEWMPEWFDPKLPLNVRAAFNVYRSRVAALPGPDNRLDGQQPWSANAGFDYRFTSVPLNLGVSFAYTPGYLTTQTLVQSMDQARTRSLDVVGQWVLSPTSSVRFSVNNLAPLDTLQQTYVTNGISRLERSGRSQFGLSWEKKL